MSRRDKRWPPINAVASALRDYAARIDWPLKKSEDDYCDVRLQVRTSEYSEDQSFVWQIHLGPSDYDLDHRGWWGAGCIPRGAFNSRALAAELIRQAQEQEVSARDVKIAISRAVRGFNEQES